MDKFCTFEGNVVVPELVNMKTTKADPWIIRVDMEVEIAYSFASPCHRGNLIAGQVE
jgi:hypothetical protein